MDGATNLPRTLRPRFDRLGAVLSLVSAERPDDTTLIRWANQIGPSTVASLNERASSTARSVKVSRGRKLRVDSTVVETNVHHPTDRAACFPRGCG
jgi:hypothetical protein